MVWAGGWDLKPHECGEAEAGDRGSPEKHPYPRVGLRNGKVGRMAGGGSRDGLACPREIQSPIQAPCSWRRGRSQDIQTNVPPSS